MAKVEITTADNGFIVEDKADGSVLLFTDWREALLQIEEYLEVEQVEQVGVFHAKEEKEDAE